MFGDFDKDNPVSFNMQKIVLNFNGEKKQSFEIARFPCFLWVEQDRLPTVNEIDEDEEAIIFASVCLQHFREEISSNGNFDRVSDISRTYQDSLDPDFFQSLQAIGFEDVTFVFFPDRPF